MPKCLLLKLTLRTPYPFGGLCTENYEALSALCCAVKSNILSARTQMSKDIRVQDGDILVILAKPDN